MSTNQNRLRSGYHLLRGVQILVIGFLCLAGAVMWYYKTSERKWNEAIAVTTSRAEPIIQAIERYRQEKKELPETLKALVPTYLSVIPAPGHTAKSGWEYSLSINEKGEIAGWSLSVECREEFSPPSLFLLFESLQHDELIFCSKDHPPGAIEWMPIIKKHKYGSWRHDNGSEG